jgi:hypothetical protein
LRTKATLRAVSFDLIFMRLKLYKHYNKAPLNSILKSSFFHLKRLVRTANQ